MGYSGIGSRAVNTFSSMVSTIQTGENNIKNEPIREAARSKAVDYNNMHDYEVKQAGGDDGYAKLLSERAAADRRALEQKQQLDILSKKATISKTNAMASYYAFKKVHSTIKGGSSPVSFNHVGQP